MSVLSISSPSPPPISPHCLNILRQNDFDRYIASLFVPAPKRVGLVAIWAFDSEMTRLSAQVKEPLMAEIRLRWWCDEIEKFATSPHHIQYEAQNPLLFALEQTIIHFCLPKQSFITACEAQMRLSYPSDSYAQDLSAAEDEAVFFQLACQILMPGQSHRAQTACLHAGQLKILSRTQTPELSLLRDACHAFIAEMTQLPRPLRPAFSSLATLCATSRAKKLAKLSPLRRLWLITRASLGGHFPYSERT